MNNNYMKFNIFNKNKEIIFTDIVEYMKYNIFDPNDVIEIKQKIDKINTLDMHEIQLYNNKYELFECYEWVKIVKKNLSIKELLVEQIYIATLGYTYNNRPHPQ